jgi:hypothetical protein
VCGNREMYGFCCGPLSRCDQSVSKEPDLRDIRSVQSSTPGPQECHDALTQWDFLADVDLLVRSSQMRLHLSFDAVDAIPIVHTRESPGFDIERS